VSIERKHFQGLGHLEFLARQVVEGFITGLHKSPFHGFSVEFAEHRAYNAGESTRHIDWKLYARTDKLFVKNYEEETNLRCQIIIDASSSMYFPEVDMDKDDKWNKMKFSVYGAAVLIQLLRKQRDAVGLSIFADEVRQHTQTKSNSVHHRFLFSELEKLISNDVEHSQRPTFAVDAIHSIAQKLHRRSLVVIFSDMMDNSERSEELFSALQHLKFNKHEVILFHVVDKAMEVDFELENRPYTFIDLESGQKVKADPIRIRETYKKAMSEFEHELKLKCAQYAIDLVKVDINEGFYKVMQEYLIKRGKMF